MKLAYEIVKIYHNEKKAEEAQNDWIKKFQKKEIPDDMKEIKCVLGEDLADILVKNKVLSSKGEYRRMVLGKAVHDLEKKENITELNIKINKDLTLKIGKKIFVKILIK